MVHGRPGRAPQTTKRQEFARLIALGVPSVEACRLVGVNARTGKRWEHGVDSRRTLFAATPKAAGRPSSYRLPSVGHVQADHRTRGSVQRHQ